jgi:hypothetical protein
MRTKPGSWLVDDQRVRWIPGRGLGQWKVSGRPLPNNRAYSQRDWEVAVIAWQMAVCESFADLNSEVDKLKNQVKALTRRARKQGP